LRSALGIAHAEPGTGTEASVPTYVEHHRSAAAKTLNGPLWSLIREYRCYLIVAVLFCLPAVRRRPKPFMLGPFVATSVYGYFDWGGVTGGGSHAQILTRSATTLLPYFFAGALLWAFRDRVPYSRWLMTASAIAITAFSVLWVGFLFAPLPLAYLVLNAGHALPRWTRRINQPNDITDLLPAAGRDDAVVEPRSSKARSELKLGLSRKESELGNDDGAACARLAGGGGDRGDRGLPRRHRR
jgi:hypothetical protein